MRRNIKKIERLKDIEGKWHINTDIHF
jgi:hypothetical protein